MSALPCIVCSAALENVWGDSDQFSETPNQPYAGTTFSSHGHYGSTVFDPYDDRQTLEINVCDSCLIRAATRGGVQHNRLVSWGRHVFTHKPWSGVLHD